MNVDFNTNILNQLLQDSELAPIAIDKFPKVNEWNTKYSKPTYLQLVELAKIFHIPFGYFFLEKIPTKKYPIPHYRTITNKQFKASGELLETIETIEQRRGFARNILQESRKPLTFANSITIKTDIDKAAQLLRDTLKLPVDWASTLEEQRKGWREAFFMLTKRAEQAGIFVVQNSKENGRVLKVEEFRGFVLYDEYAPFIFINGNDFFTGKMFTIIHEIAHILIGESASFDFANLNAAHNDIEQFCDRVTAEFLVPKILILKEYESGNRDYANLAERFKVSRIVIARRLQDLNKISEKEFMAAYNSFQTGFNEVNKKGDGGMFYNSAPYKISREFFKLVYNSVKSNRLLYRDAFRLTGLTPKSFDGYIKEYFNKD